MARILSNLFYGFGILNAPRVVECDRSKLVGSYLGETANKTDAVIDTALDGVLFIDEAYTLVKDSAKYGHSDSYGDEAINQLLKRMEDNRDRLIVIAAGYPGLMDEFIHANPGLKSRFTRYITFEDYSSEEMCRIFEKLAKENEYSLSSDCLAYLAAYFLYVFHRRDDKFGNAREVRNAFEAATNIHSERVSLSEVAPTREELTTLHGTDIQTMVNETLGATSFDLSNAQWRFECAECGKQGVESGRFLGRRVKCGCGTRFDFPWWSLIPESVPGLTSSPSAAKNPFGRPK